MAHRALLAAALSLTRLAPSGSPIYAIHIWLHAWTDRSILVDGVQPVLGLEAPSPRSSG